MSTEAPTFPPSLPPWPAAPASEGWFEKWFCDAGEDVLQCGPSFGQTVTAGGMFILFCVIPCLILCYRRCCQKAEKLGDTRSGHNLGSTSTTAPSIELRIMESSVSAEHAASAT